MTVSPVLHSGELFKSASCTSPFIFIVHSSTASPSFGHLKPSVLLLAGEGTSGSWIPVIINLHILFRRCIILDLVHVRSIASFVLLGHDLLRYGDSDGQSWSTGNYSRSFPNRISIDHLRRPIALNYLALPTKCPQPPSLDTLGVCFYEPSSILTERISSL
ncbi:unnamed protein product [Microthlaspi erraticum]|uniref:Uncharacterized protein n=1 Tax=Microthlaspi erraticum TaxID=1685480 RepID=A0A6D2JZZ9_9BRAS|nr:unnamed protein product [Microthlaspi erraticum]